MPTVEKSIVVDRPLKSVYRQWARFEDYPSFMSEIVHVRRPTAAYQHWRLEIGGGEFELEVEITEQSTDRAISWASRDAEGFFGKVKVHALSADRTLVMLQIAYPLERLPRDVDAVETLRALVQGGLERFRRMMESWGTGHG